MDFDNIPEDAGFHASCYIRFIDKKSFSAAVKRVTQTVEERGADADQSMPSDNIAEASTSSEPPWKKLRSRTGLPVPSSGPVLPPLCIICKKVEKLINVAGKRQRDRLSLAETLTAGKPQTHTRTHWNYSQYGHVRYCRQNIHANFGQSNVVFPFYNLLYVCCYYI